MRTFSVGDKVKVNQAEYTCNENIANGMIGTICGYKGGLDGVVFEHNIGGHTCGGKCEYGYGWFVREEYLEPVEIEMDADEDDLALFMDSIPIV